MQKIIVIVGATGTKKTQLAIKLAQSLNGEIINADSYQVYKELNAGINKPTLEELAGIKHHLINSHSIYDTFDIKIFQDICNVLIKDILTRQKTVILCGGSNLYIDAVIKGYNLNKSSGRHEINHFDDWTYDDIYNYVLEHDPQEALKIHYNNTKRITRAAQIIHATKTPKSQLDLQKFNFVYDCFIIETILDREILYNNINERVNKMLAKNWLQEVTDLVASDPQVRDLQAFKAIGYGQILLAIVQHIPIDVALIQQTTRQLAKRQMTWNRNKYPEIHRFDVTHDDFKQLLTTIRGFLAKK